MAGVCFFFEPEDVDVWSGKDLDAWRYACKAAGDVDRMAVVNRTAQHIEDRADADEILVTVHAAIPAFRGKVAYVATPWEDVAEPVPLWSFDHDVDWYLFGPAGGWQRPLDRALIIPQAGRGALHAVHVASVVLLHRYSVVSS